MQLHSVFIKEVERLRRLLIGMGLSVEDGEDVLQNVYLEVLKRPPNHGNLQETARWLMRVTINKCLREFRQKRRNQQAKNEISHRCGGQEKTQSGPYRQIIRREETEAMKQCLYKMDESFQVPLVMRYFCGLNSSEISKILELKPGTVRKRLYQGRVILAEMLLQKGIRP